MWFLPPAAVVLLQTSALIGFALCVHVYAVRHLSSNDVPAFLWRRIELTVRLRPAAIVGAVVLATVGLALGLR